MHETVPSISSQTVSAEQETLKDMLIGDAVRGEVMSYMEEHRGAMEAATRAIADATDARLRETHAMQRGAEREIARLLVDAATIVRSLFGLVIKRLRTGSAADVYYMGLPNYASMAATSSSLSLTLRRLLPDRPGLADAADALSRLTLPKAYALPPQVAPTMRHLTGSQLILQQSLEDASSAVRLAEIVPSLRAYEWRRRMDRMPDIATGHCAISSDRSVGLLMYLANAGAKREMVAIHHPESRKATGFSMLNGMPCVKPHCPYAGLPEIAGGEVLPAVVHTLEGMRGELQRVLDAHPLVAANMGQLGRVEFHTLYNDPDWLEAQTDTEHQAILEGLLPPPDPEQEASPPAEAADDVAEAQEPEETEGPTAFRLRQMQFGKLDRLLKQLGIEKIDDEGKGSHTKYRNPLSDRFCTITRRYSHKHTREVPRRIVARSIADLALTAEQALRLMTLLEEQG